MRAAGARRMHTLCASAPFAAEEGEPFLTLWLAPQVVVNGWEPDDGPLLSRIRVVTALWSGEDLGPAAPVPRRFDSS